VSPKTNKKAPKTFIINVLGAFYCCRGRDRTSKWQLAITQSSVVDPGRPDYSGRLYVTFIPLSPPSRQEGMYAKISSPHSI